MVGVSRVFDIEGLWEVIGEVRGISRIEVEQSGEDDAVPVEQNMQKEVEIADSDDEGSPLTPSAREVAPNEAEDEGIEIIIVDNMTQIINELFSRKEKSEGTSPPRHITVS